VKLRNGILGTGVNKIGNVIGATWKGIAYVRSYVIPKNPNTEAQQAVRAFYRIVGRFGSTILGSVLQKFWDPTAVAMSGYNAFIKAVKKKELPIPPLKNMVLCAGRLEGCTSMQSNYYSPTGALGVSWDDTVLGNGLATDKAVIVCHDNANNVSFVSDGVKTRGDNNAVIDIGEGRLYSDLTAWIFFYRGTKAPYLQSPSIGVDVTEQISPP
jgi:hypothetical protein